jgi:hypothetical protein
VSHFSSLLAVGLALSATSALADVSVNAGVGLGQFQDIQVPVNIDAGQRGDGTAALEENADHIGVPINFVMGYGQDRVNWLANVAFDATSMRATTGPAATQSSSYSRYELRGDYRRRFVSFGRTLAIGPRLGLRRTSFQNVSSAHFVDAAMIGGAIAGETHDFAWDLRLATAAAARFGFTDEGIFGGKPFDKSKTAVYEIAAMTSSRLDASTWLEVGVLREMIRATIDDVGEYNGFGLSVTPAAAPSRAYDLATTTLQIGIRKSF